MAGNYDIGPRVGIEGDKTFKNSLNAIQSNIKNLGSEMKLMAATFDGGADSMEAVSAKSDLLKKSITATEQQISLLSGEYDRQVRTLANLDDALNKAIKEYGEQSAEAQKAQNAYNKQSIKVNKLSTQLNNAKTSMAKLNNELRDTEDAMSAASGSTSKLEKGLGAIGSAVKGMLGLKKNTDDVADSMGKAHKSSLSFGDAVKAIVTSEAIVGGFRMIGSAVKDMTRKLADFAKGGLETASDLQEVQNVVDVTFGEGNQVIEQFAKTAANSFGMSELSAKQFTGTMGAMLKSMNLDDAAVEEMSIALTGLAGDMASFYNLDAEEAFDKLRSGISGETEPLKQLGINMSVTNLEAYALSQGISTAWKEMSAAEQATLRYQYIMQATADAQGDFARTSDSYANQQRILQLNMENLSASIGEKLLPVMTGFTSSLNDLLGGEVTLSEFISSIGEQVAGLAGQFAESLPELLQAGGELIATVVQGIGEAIPQVLESGGQILSTLSEGLMTNLPAMVDSGLETIGNFLDTLIDALPDVLQMGFDILMTVADGIIKKIPDMVKKLPEVISSLAKFFTENFPKLVEMGGKLVVQLTIGLVKSIPDIINAAGDLIEAVMTYFVYRVKGFVDVGKNIVQGILDGLGKSWGDVTAWFDKKLGGLVSSVKNLLGINSPSKVFAEIGANTAEGLSVGFGRQIGAVGKKIQADMNSIIPSASGSVTVAAGGNVSKSDTAGAVNMAAAVRDALSGAAVYMDGKRVGKLITAAQNNTTRALGVSPAKA